MSFPEFFAKIELDPSAGTPPLIPQYFTLHSSIHADPLAFDPASLSWMFDYSTIPFAAGTIRLNISTQGEFWPIKNALQRVFSPLRLTITTFSKSDDEPRRALRTTVISVEPWYLPTSALNVVKGSFFVKWDATPFQQAGGSFGLRNSISELSVNEFYKHLLPADFTPWPSDLPLPGRFLLSASKIVDFFGTHSAGTSFQNTSTREDQLDSLTGTAGRQLGLNCCHLDRWTWKEPYSPVTLNGTINPATVNRIADGNHMRFRAHYCTSVLSAYTGYLNGIGMGIHFETMYSIWKHAHYLRDTSSTVESAQRELMRKGIHAGGEGTEEYSKPWSRLRLLVLGEETNFNVNEALHLFLSKAQIAALTPGSVPHEFRWNPKYLLGTLKQPLPPGWESAQDITLQYHADFIDFIKRIDNNPAQWGVPDFRDLGPIFVEKINPTDLTVGPWEQLAREGDPCAATQEGGSCAIKRKLYLHTIYFLHDQVAQSSGLMARRATEVIRELASPHDPKFYIGFATNSFYCRALMRGALVFRDSFAEARQNAELVKQGLNPITPWMEDNNMNGDLLPDLIGHAEFLRSVAMMSLPAGDRWPAMPGPGLVGEHSLYFNLATYRPDETDDLLYRGFVQVGSGAKALDFYGGLGPEIRAVTADGESEFELNVWAPGHRTGHARKLTEMLHRVEDVLFPARPQRSPIAVLITRCSEVWDTTPEYPAYAIERIRLATALAHAGHPLDYIDEVDLLGDKSDPLSSALFTRNYVVLYLVDPNLSKDAVPIVRRWVEMGGTLAVLPGAAVEDEYGYRAGPEIDQMLGVARREHLFAKNPVPVADVRGLKTKEGGWDLTGSQPLGLKVHDSRLLFSGSASTFAVSAPEWAQADNTPLWKFYPVAGGSVETLATWVALDAAGTATAELTFPDGDQQVPLPALTRREHGKGAALCYGIMPGAMYLGSTSYDHSAGLAPRRYNWKPDLRLFAIAPLRTTPRGVISHAVGARIVNMSQVGIPTALDTHGAASVQHLQSNQGVALVVANWARDPSLSPSSSFRVIVSYLLPARGNTPIVALLDVKTASRNPVSLQIRGGYAIFEMELFSVDVITFKLGSVGSHPPPPEPPDASNQSAPPLSYIICDLGKEKLSAFSFDGRPLTAFNEGQNRIHELGAHVNFLAG